MLKKLLSQLIEVKSITGQELEAAKVLENFFKQEGYSGSLDCFEKGRANFVASFISDIKKPVLVLCSHIDVVAANNPEQWKYPPFELSQNGDRWYGRGSCDAKGSVAAMAVSFLNAVKNRNYNGNLIFVAVAGEEKGSIGARRFAMSNKGLKGSVIIGEPTNRTVQTSHKGRIVFTLDVFGKSGHASSPNNSVNAATQAVKLFNELKPYIDKYNKIHEKTGAMSFALTQFCTNEKNTNTIPGECRLVFDCRYMHSNDPKKIASLLGDKIKEIATAERVNINLEIKYGVPSANTLDTTDIVACALEACNQIAGIKKETLPFPAVCDMHVFSNIGMDTIILGAGDLYANNAHGTDEFIDISELESMVEIYEKVIYLHEDANINSFLKN